METRDYLAGNIKDVVGPLLGALVVIFTFGILKLLVKEFPNHVFVLFRGCFCAPGVLDRSEDLRLAS